MISDGFLCGFLASRSSLYDDPEGLIQAVTRDISKIFFGLNFLKQSAANGLSNWNIVVKSVAISAHTFSSFQSIS